MTDKKIQNVAIIGCGSWGTALAQAFVTAGRDVLLYARDGGLAEIINTKHENTIYLPGVALDKKIKATGDLGAAVKAADLVFLVTPAQYARETMTKLKSLLPKAVPVINCSKGIEISTGKILSEVAAEILPDHPYGILSGPTFSADAVRGLPSAITLATKHADGMLWAEAIGSKVFRPYLSHDVTGVEIAGAVKNVVAIACGIVEGKKLGQNAAAAVMTRGMAEIARLGLSRGASIETFLGLAGLGDLTLTCHSMTSRNFSLGVELGQGKKLDDIMATRRTVAEGVATAKAIASIAVRDKIDMPICAAVNAVLFENVTADQAISGLLSREIREEKV